MSTPRPQLTIDVVLDLVCPWCFIGFRGLDWAAMALSFEFDLGVRFRPYQLDPTTPVAGRDRESVWQEKFPDSEIRARVVSALHEAMADVGLSFALDRPDRLPNTLDAHRVVRWAGLEGGGREMVAALFEAYWTEGADISRHDVLAAAAETAGLGGADIEARLASDEDRADIAQEMSELRAGGVTGVPTFIVNEKAGFPGALPKAELLAALRQLAEETTGGEG
ncbi:DsbA family oxidoreductase [Parvularcula bermudensis]|uniref:DsbA family oxidoreductase n=1 Tax=Parvularcula bermudensis TaxID=208216 RepID=UPI00031F5335|nr:DsbA family oxidoreductase [Parvularcula bermudensis]